MAEINLQRCPNCGCGAELHKTKKRNNWRYYYECGGCWMRTDKCGTPEDAAQEWNELRKPEPEMMPCPFCGGDVTIETDQVDARTEVTRFVCNDCGMNTYFDGTSNDEALARDAWNRREL